jgi:glucose/arabinose dehydrogenase
MRAAVGAALVASLLTGAALIGCGDEDEPATTATGGTTTAAQAGGGVKLEKIGDFDEPLYVTQPAGSQDLYVVERAGVVKIVRDGKTLPDPFLDISDQVSTEVEQGLLSIAFAPDYGDSGLVYAYYTGTDQNNHVVEFNSDPDHVSGEPREVLTMEDYAPNHNGGLLLFGSDGHLYIGTGDAQQESRAQDRNSLNGKILRVTQDGAAAPGNPWGTRVYSMGHRNVQGLAFDSQGRLWSAEFGPSTVDELNLIRSGGNYGWGGCSTGNCIGPVRTWPVAQASPSGITIIGNTIYMACLRGQRLYRMQISGNGVTGVTALYQGRYGRLRTVEAAPGGGFWMTTSNRDANGTPRAGDDRIIHVT